MCVCVLHARLFMWTGMIIIDHYTYICIYTYKHGGLYKFAHFVCTIIIVIPRVTIVHILSDCYGLCQRMQFHFALLYPYIWWNISLLGICIYIYARMCIHIYIHMCRSCILYCKKLDILWSLLVTNSNDSLIYTSQKRKKANIFMYKVNCINPFFL